MSGSSLVEHVCGSCAMNGGLVRHDRSFSIRHSFSNPHPSLPLALLAASLPVAQRSLCSSASSPNSTGKQECESDAALQTDAWSHTAFAVFPRKY